MGRQVKGEIHPDITVMSVLIEAQKFGISIFALKKISSHTYTLNIISLTCSSHFLLLLKQL